MRQYTAMWIQKRLPTQAVLGLMPASVFFTFSPNPCDIIGANQYSWNIIHLYDRYTQTQDEGLIRNT